jgi:hypothetical protein
MDSNFSSSNYSVKFVCAPCSSSFYETGAEIHFVGGILHGTRLTGFTIWRQRDGSLSVTLPAARPYGVHYSDFLKDDALDQFNVKAVKKWILKEYKKQEFQKKLKEEEERLKAKQKVATRTPWFRGAPTHHSHFCDHKPVEFRREEECGVWSHFDDECQAAYHYTCPECWVGGAV